MKFTEEEIYQLTNEGGILDEKGNEKYNLVHQKIIAVDREKNSTDVEYIIEEVSTGKFYRAVLLDSVWIGQDEYNASQTWEEVKRKKRTSYDYE